VEEEKIQEEDEPEMEWEQRNDPDHPYCTNWPVTKFKKGEDEKV